MTRKNQQKRTHAKLPLPPTVKKVQNPTVSLSSISCGTLEKKILKFMAANQANRLNIAELSRIYKRARSTISGSLKTLMSKGLVDKPYAGNYVLTGKGKHFLEASGIHRTVCRSPQEPTTLVRDHKFTFEVKVKQWPEGWQQNQVAALLNRHTIQTTLSQFSKNNPMLHARFPGDVDVLFTTTKVIIKPKNIFEPTHTAASTTAISKAYEVIQLLVDVGFGLVDDKGQMRLIQSEGHYAEVNSILAQLFEKKTKGFCVTDDKGKAKFWIDHSNGHLEDETATEEDRDNLNSVVKKMLNGDSLDHHFDKEDISGMFAKVLEIQQESAASIAIIAKHVAKGMQDVQTHTLPPLQEQRYVG